MLVVGLLAIVACVAKGEPASSRSLTRWRCSENANGTSMTLNASEDGILGRYTCQLCTTVQRDVTKWRLDLSYFDDTTVCNQSQSFVPWSLGNEHSKVIEEIGSENRLNCTYVCLSVDLDLIFTSCYRLQSRFFVHGTSLPAFDIYRNITNQYHLSDFQKIKPRVINTYHDNGEVVVLWYLGIPLEYFEMTLCDVNHGIDVEGDKLCVNVNENCTSMGVAGSNELKCSLQPHSAFATAGSATQKYRLNLESRAPWAIGQLGAKFNTFTYINVKMVVVEQSGSEAGVQAALVWGGGVALVLAAAALAAAAACRARAAALHSKRVLRDWLNRTNEQRMVPARVEGGGASSDVEVDVEADAGVPADDKVDVVLLYARESAVGQRAVDQLRRLIEHVVTGQVYDVHSAAVTSLAARSPAAWLRGALQRRNTRVLLLQTPAAALYVATTRGTDANITLRPPVLGSGAVYRSPRFGDTLLQYALTLIADTHHPQHLYNKYYLAQLSCLPTELWPQLVPYRRYSLPGATHLLLHDLCAGGPQPQPQPRSDPEPQPQADPDPELAELTRQFEHAVHEFAQHAAAHPDYLTDELIVL